MATAAATKAIRLGHPSYVWRRGQDRRLTCIRQYVELRAKRILDIGCGLGMYVSQFRQFSDDVYGVDVDPALKAGKLLSSEIDSGGKSHYSAFMPMTKPKSKGPLTVVERYDVAADAKKRINLRNAKTKYFNVRALSNGCFLHEHRVLIPPQAISARSLKMLEKSAANMKKGLASAPISLAAFIEP